MKIFYTLFLFFSLRLRMTGAANIALAKILTLNRLIILMVGLKFIYDAHADENDDSPGGLPPWGNRARVRKIEEAALPIGINKKMSGRQTLRQSFFASCV
jgi:hypothetical protein